MGPDYDDVGAIAMLHAFADSGYVRILATVASTKYEGVAGVFNVFNTYFRRPDIVIGVPKGEASDRKDFQHWTDSLLKNYPHKILRNDGAEDAVKVYRRMLAAEKDNSVTIITTGFLTNLAALLKSKGDKYSALSGANLVKRKVKQLVTMGGRFPSGSEFNLRIDSTASKFVFDSWPTFVLFTGVEIGLKIKSGLPLIRNSAIQHSPVKDVFRICIPLAKEDSAGRMSWDETAVLIAIKGIGSWYSIKTGNIIVDHDGSNHWSMDSGKHAYIVEAESPAAVERVINKMIMHQPVISVKRKM